MTTSAPKSQGHVPAFDETNSTVSICSLDDRQIVDDLRSLVAFYFGKAVSDYLAMERDAYHCLVAAVQDEMNRRGLGRRIARACRGVLQRILRTERILIQSNLYLRAVRPLSERAQESVDWHRESFYGLDMQYAANIWLPVINVTIENTLRYVPDSQHIPDHVIETVSEQDPTVSRFSAGHRIGLLYAPKRIVSGVNFASSRPLVVLPGEVAIFSGELIHGAGMNHSEAIRFSVDFRAIAAENAVTPKQHFASGKGYFEEL